MSKKLNKKKKRKKKSKIKREKKDLNIFIYKILKFHLWNLKEILLKANRKKKNENKYFFFISVRFMLISESMKRLY